MSFTDGSGSITLQNFTLADGEICVRAEYFWTGSNALGSFSIYPKAENFDWQGAAARIADGWMKGSAAMPTTTVQSTEPSSGMEHYVAAV